jgi:putative membrane protein
LNGKDSGWIMILIIVLVIVLLGPFMFMGAMWGPGMMGGWHMGQGMMGYGYGYGFNWIASILQTILFVVFLGLIVFGAYYLISGGRLKSSEKSLDIIKERYAKGEISKEDYDRMKKELKED